MAFHSVNGGQGSDVAIRDVEKMCEHLESGGIVLLPTETGYLLGVDGTNTDAVDHLFRVKGRAPDHSVSLAVADVAMAKRFGRLDSFACALLSKWSPGPLTIVVSKGNADLSPSLSRGSTIGLRIPDHRFTLEVLRVLNRPITATSANRSGSAPKQQLFQIVQELDPYVEGDWLGVKDDMRKYDKPSTIVRIQESVEILREGPISEAEILAAKRISDQS